MNKILLLIAIATLTGCASLHQGSQQYVTISPENSSSAAVTQCTLSNEEGKWETTANTRTQIDRDGNGMNVDCSNETETGKTVAVPEFSTKYLMIDIILLDACLISCIIDGANNAFYTYPDSITIPMEKKLGLVSSSSN
jgi:uncharacterized protein YceK